MQEIWKDIPDYEGLYQASNFGKVKSLNYRKTQQTSILKPWYSKLDGYFHLYLWKNKNKTAGGYVWKYA